MTYHDVSLARADRRLTDMSGTPTEWLSRRALDRKSRIVVGVSLRDPSSSVDPNSRMPRLMSRLFGIPAPAPLADPRLESLRRFCILYRDGDARSTAEADLLTSEFGYSEGMLEEVRAEIRGRTDTRWRSACRPAPRVAPPPISWCRLTRADRLGR